MTSRSFDERNDQDFKRVTAQISSALELISSNPSEAATVANLSKLAETHRNTLYKRARMCELDNGGNEQGWPLTRLKQIASERLAKARKAATPIARNTPADELQVLQRRLERARFVSTRWFERMRAMKSDRDEARTINRNLIAELEGLKIENDRLRRMLRDSMRPTS